MALLIESLLTSAQVKPLLVTATNIYSLAHLITLLSVFVVTTDKTNTYLKRLFYTLSVLKIRIYKKTLFPRKNNTKKTPTTTHYTISYRL